MSWLKRSRAMNVTPVPLSYHHRWLEFNVMSTRKTLLSLYYPLSSTPGHIDGIDPIIPGLCCHFWYPERHNAFNIMFTSRPLLGTDLAYGLSWRVWLHYLLWTNLAFNCAVNLVFGFQRASAVAALPSPNSYPQIQEPTGQIGNTTFPSSLYLGRADPVFSLTLSGYYHSPDRSSVDPASPVVVEDITANFCFHPSCCLLIGCCVYARCSLVLWAPAIREAVHIAEHLSFLVGAVWCRPISIIMASQYRCANRGDIHCSACG